MSTRPSGEATPAPAGRARCRCGHLPTHHMLVVPVGSTVGFRLDPSGPCAICGVAVCGRYTPAPP